MIGNYNIWYKFLTYKGTPEDTEWNREKYKNMKQVNGETVRALSLYFLVPYITLNYSLHLSTTF